MSFRGFDPTRDVPSLEGKAVLVTGGTSGLGRETVLELARHRPGHVFFTGRNREAARSLIEECAPHLLPVALDGGDNEGETEPENGDRTSNGRGHISFIECDHASLASIAAAAEAILTLTPRLDIFIANAGIMATPPGLTADGLEVQLGTNHVGNAALLLRLLPLMLRTASIPGADVRFVSVTSLGYFAHPARGIDFAALTTPDGGTGGRPGGAWTRYGQSKLANILLAGELRRRYGGRIASVAVHPGTVRTELVSRLGFWNRMLVYVTNPRGLLSPREGSYGIVWAAAAADVRDKLAAATEGAGGGSKGRGAFFGPVGVPDAGDAKCWDEELARELWEWTERTVGVESPPA
ncbi:hypothetical protein PCL_05619 [Purpureocillium lilacinum]|uniref:Uncharacterized protein n=1 Tax=Purpureocillium lilacinum TaxID=33203 RepID=A0A2U3DUG0_PURLI|nr:hypothetical protein PCL_05619 [Purpureocillium lilacinum]